MQKISLSTVTPVYLGKAYLPTLVTELAELRTHWETEGAPMQLIEAIFVDDASIDGSATVLECLVKEYPWIRVITLSKNFGQHPATVAGILYSSGDWVVTLDEDLQHRPKYIVDMLKRVAMSPVDIVYAHPVDAVHRKGYRDLASRWVKNFLAWATGSPMVRYFNSFRLVRGTIARAAASVCGHETYFDMVIGWFGNKFEIVPLIMEDNRFIHTGQSGYSFRKLVSHARRLILSSHPKFLRTGATMGFFAVIVALLLTGKVLYGIWFDSQVFEVRGWASLFISILFFGGVSTLMLGVILEYLNNVVLHTQGKPVFFQVDRRSDALLRTYFSKKKN